MLINMEPCFPIALVEHQYLTGVKKNETPVSYVNEHCLDQLRQLHEDTVCYMTDLE